MIFYTKEDEEDWINALASIESPEARKVIKDAMIESIRKAFENDIKELEKLFK